MTIDRKIYSKNDSLESIKIVSSHKGISFYFQTFAAAFSFQITLFRYRIRSVFKLSSTRRMGQGQCCDFFTRILHLSRPMCVVLTVIVLLRGAQCLHFSPMHLIYSHCLSDLFTTFFLHLFAGHTSSHKASD